MIQKMFSVRDCKAQAFLQPFFSTAVGSAVRALEDAVNDGQSPIAKHPADYVLYEVGSFDDQTGEVATLAPIKLLAVASELKSAIPDKTINQVIESTVNGKK